MYPTRVTRVYFGLKVLALSVVCSQLKYILFEYLGVEYVLVEKHVA